MADSHMIYYTEYNKAGESNIINPTGDSELGNVKKRISDDTNFKNRHLKYYDESTIIPKLSYGATKSRITEFTNNEDFLNPPRDKSKPTITNHYKQIPGCTNTPHMPNLACFIDSTGDPHATTPWHRDGSTDTLYNIIESPIHNPKKPMSGMDWRSNCPLGGDQNKAMFNTVPSQLEWNKRAFGSTGKQILLRDSAGIPNWEGKTPSEIDLLINQTSKNYAMIFKSESTNSVQYHNPNTFKKYILNSDKSKFKSRDNILDKKTKDKIDSYKKLINVDGKRISDGGVGYLKLNNLERNFDKNINKLKLEYINPEVDYKTDNYTYKIRSSSIPLEDTTSKSIFSTSYPLTFDPIYFNWMYLHEPSNYVLWTEIKITIQSRTNSTVPQTCTSNYNKKENFTQQTRPNPYKIPIDNSNYDNRNDWASLATLSDNAELIKDCQDKSFTEEVFENDSNTSGGIGSVGGAADAADATDATDTNINTAGSRDSTGVTFEDLYEIDTTIYTSGSTGSTGSTGSVGQIITGSDGNKYYKQDITPTGGISTEVIIPEIYSRIYSELTQNLRNIFIAKILCYIKNSSKINIYNKPIKIELNNNIYTVNINYLNTEVIKPKQRLRFTSIREEPAEPFKFNIGIGILNNQTSCKPIIKNTLSQGLDSNGQIILTKQNFIKSQFSTENSNKKGQMGFNYLIIESANNKEFEITNIEIETQPLNYELEYSSTNDILKFKSIYSPDNSGDIICNTIDNISKSNNKIILENVNKTFNTFNPIELNTPIYISNNFSIQFELENVYLTTNEIKLVQLVNLDIPLLSIQKNLNKNNIFYIYIYNTPVINLYSKKEINYTYLNTLDIKLSKNDNKYTLNYDSISKDITIEELIEDLPDSIQQEQLQSFAIKSILSNISTIKECKIYATS